MDTRDHLSSLRCRHAVFTLDGGNGTIAAARHLTRAFLDELDPALPTVVTMDALTLVSELATNAVRHAPGPCTLYLVYDSSGAGELTIAISDTSTSPPAPRVPDLNAGTGGLGWHLIQRLTTQIRIHPVPPWGKTIDTTLNTAVL
jgi:anti-sigma regulatory factor (Ser/Thr protein kinase)